MICDCRISTDHSLCLHHVAFCSNYCSIYCCSVQSVLPYSDAPSLMKHLVLILANKIIWIQLSAFILLFGRASICKSSFANYFLCFTVIGSDLAAVTLEIWPVKTKMWSTNGTVVVILRSLLSVLLLLYVWCIFGLYSKLKAQFGFDFWKFERNCT